MRSSITLLLLLFTVESLYSQAEYDSRNLSAGISGVPLFFNSKDKGLSVAGYALKGSFGVFINKKLSLENNLFYYYDDDLYNNETDVASTSYGIQISLRYHYKLLEKLKIYLDAGAGLGNVEYSDDYNFYKKYNSGIVLYTVSAGALIRLFPNLDLEIAMPYLFVFNTNNDLNPFNFEGDRGKLLYSGIAGPTLGFRYSF